MLRRTSLAAVLALAALWLPAFAGESDDLLQLARDAHADQVEANLAVDEALKAYRIVWKPVNDARLAGTEATPEQKKAYGEGMAELRAAREHKAKLGDAFRDAFAATDWAAWNPEEDAELLREGLYGILSSNASKGDPALAVRAGEFLVKTLPDAKPCGGAAQNLIVRALSKTGDMEAAVERAGELLPGVKEERYRGYITLLTGDMLCAMGSTERATAEYAKVLESIPEDSEDKGLLRVRKYATLRANLVGKAPPEIDSRTWTAGEAKPLSALRGKVVIADFWATWCGPCRAVMPDLDALARKHADDGLVVLGVTRHYERGYLPEAGEKKAESAKDMDETQFMEHLAEFRVRTGFSYPFVVGAKSDFTNYGISGIPTMVVIDREGKVALVLVGSGSEALLHRALGRLLATGGEKPADGH